MAGLGQPPEAFPRPVVAGRSNGTEFELVKMFPVIGMIFTVMNFTAVSGTSYVPSLKGLDPLLIGWTTVR